MQKTTWTEPPPIQNEPCWGCVFCKTGLENAVVKQLHDAGDIISAFTIRQVQHHSERGQRSEIIKIMLPGYVFFQAYKDLDLHLFYHNENIIRLLSYGEAWALRGDDLAFARLMHQHDGLLGMSKAYHAGQRIVIESGPLKELKGMIVKVDHHNRNGLVNIEFGGRLIKVWLAFEYISEERL